MFGWLLLDWLRGFKLLLGGCGFHDDISVEVLVQALYSCRIQCCVSHPLSEYHISGAVKHLIECIVYEVLLSRYTVPNEYAASGSVILHRWFLFRNVDESQAFESNEMLQTWLPSGSMPGLIQRHTNQRSYRSAVLEIDRHCDCKRQILLQQCSIVQDATYVLQARAGCVFHDSISLR
jgi:hypothetical protein